MSKSKPYFLNNPPENSNVLFLRDELHQALKQAEFIVEIPVTENESIDIKENNPNSKFKQILINQLNYKDDKSKVERIWKVDLEKKLPGISTNSRTPECAILVLQKYESSYRLNIFLIELKSFVDNKKLKEIEEKFSCAMSRLYMLLVLNQHLNPIQGYNEETIYIDFQGFLFYNDSKFDNNDGQLYSILQASNKSGILTCETILRQRDKIKVKCFEFPNNDVITMNLQKLLSN